MSKPRSIVDRFEDGESIADISGYAPGGTFGEKLRVEDAIRRALKKARKDRDWWRAEAERNARGWQE